MKRLVRVAGLVLSGIILVLSAFSCSQGGVSQDEYDTLKSQLDQANIQIAELKSQQADTAAIQLQYNQLNTKFEDLQAQNETNVARINSLESQAQALEDQVAAVNGEKQIIQAGYDDLELRYQELDQKYQDLTLPAQPITEETVEQAIFELINQERINNGLTPVGWGYNMYSLARQNGKYMAELGRYEYAQWAFFQQLYWAAGYSSVDNIARGVMLIWTNNQYQYEHGMLSTAFKYCAVGAYKQGEVIYITMMMSDFP